MSPSPLLMESNRGTTTSLVLLYDNRGPSLRNARTQHSGISHANALDPIPHWRRSAFHGETQMHASLLRGKGAGGSPEQEETASAIVAAERLFAVVGRPEGHNCSEWGGSSDSGKDKAYQCSLNTIPWETTMWPMACLVRGPRYLPLRSP